MNAFSEDLKSNPRTSGLKGQSAWLYNVRFFLGCLRPRYWREYTAEYPNLRATVPPVARQTCGGTHVLRSVR